MTIFLGRRHLRHPMPPKALLADVLQYQKQLDQRYEQILEVQARTQQFLSDVANIIGAADGQQLEVLESGHAARDYLVGSWFLHRCHEYLVQGEPEWMLYVTGVCINGVHTLDQMATFPFEKQSAGYVKGDQAFARDVLLDMAEMGHRLQAVYHSHRLTGPNAVSPSAIDKAHQERLERGGYPVVSAIFSEDGYIRFFTIDQPFKVHLYGKGVDQVEEYLFKLATVSR